MMKQQIEKLSPYFKSMNIENNIVYVFVKFPKQWDVPNIITQEFRVEYSPMYENSKTGDFVFWSDLVNGFDAIYNAVIFSIRFNETAQEKMELLNQKIGELKQLFFDEELDVLKTLNFTFKTKKKKTISPKDIIKRVEDVVETSNDNTMTDTEIYESTTLPDDVDLYDDNAKFIWGDGIKVLNNDEPIIEEINNRMKKAIKIKE